MSLRYMTGESRAEEERYHCPRCDTLHGYICAEHREPSYGDLQPRVAALADSNSRHLRIVMSLWRAYEEAKSNEECAEILRLYCKDGAAFWRRFVPKRPGEE